MYVLIEKITLKPSDDGHHYIYADLLFEGCAPTSFEQQIHPLGYVDFVIVSQNGCRASAAMCGLHYLTPVGKPKGKRLPQLPIRLSEAVAG